MKTFSQSCLHTQTNKQRNKLRGVCVREREGKSDDASAAAATATATANERCKPHNTCQYCTHISTFSYTFFAAFCISLAS